MYDENRRAIDATAKGDAVRDFTEVFRLRNCDNAATSRRKILMMFSHFDPVHKCDGQMGLQ